MLVLKKRKRTRPRPRVRPKPRVRPRKREKSFTCFWLCESQKRKRERPRPRVRPKAIPTPRARPRERKLLINLFPCLKKTYFPTFHFLTKSIQQMAALKHINLFFRFLFEITNLY